MLLLVTVLAMLAAMMPGVAGAAAKKDSSKSKEAGTDVAIVGPGSAKGKGVDSNGNKVKFSAKSSKGAAAPDFPAKGKYSAKNSASGLFVQGKVQCLEVDGTGGANFEGPVTKSNVYSGGEPIDFDVFDSGEPKGQGDLFQSGSTPACIPPTHTGSRLASGNIVVKLAPA
jgi:hypothetical protein